MKPAALSTMWMQHRFQHVRPFAAAAREMGFAAIELSHYVTPAMIEGLCAGEVKVVSLHYPAPTVYDERGRRGDALLASPDEEGRRWAVEQARVSVDTARQLGATTLCVHMGAVEMDYHLCWALEQRYLAGQSQKPEYVSLREHILRQREAHQAPHLAAARRSLADLAAVAESSGIRIGLENRRHPHEIPTLTEMRTLLAEHDPDWVGLWYDAGHAQALAELGFGDPADWEDLCAQRGVGVHLHDCVGVRDHLVPGLGAVDFRRLATKLPQDIVRVCEVDWYFGGDELRGGREMLVELGCLTPSFD